MLRNSEIKERIERAKRLGMTKLDLSSIFSEEYGLDNISTILESIKDSQITSLDLSNNHISSTERIKALCDGLKDTKITHLTLCSNYINEPEKIQALCDGLKDTKVTDLNLGNNSLGASGTIKVLFESIKGSQITSLGLSDRYSISSNCIYTLQEIEDLCSGIKDSKITCIKLPKFSNKYIISAIKHLTDALKDSQVTSLQLDKEMLGANDDRKIEKLFKGIKDSQVTSFTLRNSKIVPYILGTQHLPKDREKRLKIIKKEGKAIAALGRGIKDSQITSLDLSCNSLKDPDVIRFLFDCMRGLYEKSSSGIIGNLFNRHTASHQNDREGLKLTSLNLSGNWINTHKAIEVLCSELKDSQITTIDLSDNGIDSTEKIKVLCDGLEDTKITFINLGHINMTVKEDVIKILTEVNLNRLANGKDEIKLIGSEDEIEYRTQESILTSIYKLCRKNQLSDKEKDELRDMLKNPHVPKCITAGINDLDETMMHVVVRNGNLDAVQLIGEAYKDTIRTKNDLGNPLHLAVELCFGQKKDSPEYKNFREIIELLMKLDSDSDLDSDSRAIFQQNRGGNTPAHIAARQGILDILKPIPNEIMDIENKYGDTCRGLEKSKRKNSCNLDRDNQGLNRLRESIGRVRTSNDNEKIL